MKIVEIYCPECDYGYDTCEHIPGTPPSCPKCGETRTKYLNDVPEHFESIAQNSENIAPNPLHWR